MDAVPVDPDTLARLVEAGDLMSELVDDLQELVDDLQASQRRLLAEDAKLRRANTDLTRTLAGFEHRIYHAPCAN